MRKRYARVSRPVPSPISTDQHMALVLVPRMHLEMILDQAVDLHYQRSVLGVFDLALAIAILQDEVQARDEFTAAQRLMYAKTLVLP